VLAVSSLVPYEMLVLSICLQLARSLAAVVLFLQSMRIITRPSFGVFCHAFFGRPIFLLRSLFSQFRNKGLILIIKF